MMTICNDRIILMTVQLLFRSLIITEIMKFLMVAQIDWTVFDERVVNYI